jgi:hypothetical protein
MDAKLESQKQKIKYPQITQISQISVFGLGNARQLKWISSSVELRYLFAVSPFDNKKTTTSFVRSRIMFATPPLKYAPSRNLRNLRNLRILNLLPNPRFMPEGV